MINIDCHNHSNHSFDGNSSIRDMVETALDNGVKFFTITDHCDVNESEKNNITVEIPSSILEINSLKYEFAEKGMTLLAGIELGQPLYNIELSKQMMNIEGMDFILGSVHQLIEEEDFYFIDFSNHSADDLNSLMRKYYNELYQTAKTNLYDSMAHITYPYRYMKERACEVNYKQFDDIVCATYKYLIEQNKAIELNTSSSFITNQFDRNLIIYYLRLYHSLGGENLTIGSDAHSPVDIGRGMDLAKDILSDIGFKYLTYYQNRKPIKVKIG